jgi:CRP/FNR family transcriptional regulator, cyclic AMP receptor protein
VPKVHDRSQTLPLDLPVAPPWLSRVSVLHADRDLAAAVPADDLPRAQRALWTTSVSFETGRVDLTPELLSPTVFALLVLKGALTRQTRLRDRPMIELLLAGDVLLPWPPSLSAPLAETRLDALDDVRLAVLDHRFVKVAAVWPALMITIQRRLNDQQHRLATHGAICQLPRVEERVMAVMRLLAARTGNATPRGTELAEKLTHEALAQLTGSRRPTVSLAVKHLRQQGYLSRRENGAWLLPQIQADDPMWSR